MAYYIIKLLVSASMILAISEISKRYSFWGAVLASVPLTSVLAMIWIYQETKDIQKISELSMGIFWLVIPSLSFFIVLHWLLKKQVSFYPSLSISLVMMIALYFLMVLILKKVGITI